MPADTDGRPGRRLRLAVLLRIAAHLAVWVPFAYALAGNLQRGWVAVTDNSAIALRTWDVLTTHGPLVGQATRLGKGVFDSGPLEYWLLALPVHLDAGHGVLWGAALWCAVAGSLAIEAAWSAAGVYGGLVAAGFILGLIRWIPAIAQDPCWNPWLGVMYLTVALAAAWAVMSGRRRWWPVVVISASIAAQAHLMFVFAAGASILLALVVGLADTIRARAGARGYLWLITGVVALAVCWSAPLYQQLTGRHGNLAALLKGNSSQPTAGLSFGLKAVSAAVAPPTYWWKSMGSLRDLGSVAHRSVVTGVIALGVIAAVLVIAVVLRSRRAATLAGLSLLLSVAVIGTFASAPTSAVTRVTSKLGSLRYLLTPLYPAGVIAWLAILFVLVLLAVRVTARVRDRAPALPGAGSGAAGPARTAAMALGASYVAAVAILAFGCWWAVVHVDHALRPESTVMKDVTSASSRIQHDVRDRTIALTVLAPTNPDRRQLTFGLVYALRTLGYRAEIGSNWAVELGPQYTYRGKPMPLVTVFMQGTGISVGVTYHAATGDITKSVRSRTYP